MWGLMMWVLFINAGHVDDVKVELDLLVYAIHVYDG